MSESHPPDMGCLLCGYQDYQAFENGVTLFEVCPCCGSQSGYTYSGKGDETAHLEAVRANWFHTEHARWWSSLMPTPPNWDAKDQLLTARIPLPPHPSVQNETSKP